MTLDKAIEALKYDARMIEKNLKNGTITEKEYQDYLKTLPDCSQNVDLVNLSSLPSDRQTH